MQKLDIETVLEHYGADRIPRRARWAPMRCPFHEDRSASASVNTDTNHFRCFACDVNGDGLDLIMWREGLSDFASAIEFAETVFDASLRDVLRGPKGRTRRGSISDKPGSVRGQRSIIPTGSRRKSLTGS